MTELTEAIKSNEDSPNTECKKAKSEDNLDGELCKLWDMSMNAVRCVLKLLMVRMCKYHAILFLNKTMGKQKLPMMALYMYIYMARGSKRFLQHLTLIFG